ncbi:hypothetical protein EFB14_15690 [Rhizobium fabae]|uniref:Uncharacterized protein n=1 Tax=Rhizobium fabae TaxID=573179 RepID=A0ABY0B7R2_9HYPH|nr:hypothetical protein EFB14_15690 [Rhizobium fabae]
MCGTGRGRPHEAKTMQNREETVRAIFVSAGRQGCRYCPPPAPGVSTAFGGIVDPEGTAVVGATGVVDAVGVGSVVVCLGHMATPALAMRTMTMPAPITFHAEETFRSPTMISSSSSSSGVFSSGRPVLSSTGRLLWSSRYRLM